MSHLPVAHPILPVGAGDGEVLPDGSGSSRGCSPHGARTKKRMYGMVYIYICIYNIYVYNIYIYIYIYSDILHMV